MERRRGGKDGFGEASELSSSSWARGCTSIEDKDADLVTLVVVRVVGITGACRDFEVEVFVDLDGAVSDSESSTTMTSPSVFLLELAERVGAVAVFKAADLEDVRAKGAASHVGGGGGRYDAKVEVPRGEEVREMN